MIYRKKNRILLSLVAVASLAWTCAADGAESPTDGDLRVSFGGIRIADEPFARPYRNIFRKQERTSSLSHLLVADQTLDPREILYYSTAAYRLESAVLLHRREGSEISPAPGEDSPYHYYCIWTQELEKLPRGTLIDMQPSARNLPQVIFVGNNSNVIAALEKYPTVTNLAFHRHVPLVREDYARPKRPLLMAPIRDILQTPRAKELKHLALPPLPVTDDDVIADVVKLSKLRGLSLFCSDVSDSSLPWLAELPELRVLNLDGCRITDDGVKELAKVKNLQSLSLNGCRMVTDASLKSFHKHPKLMEIRAAGTQITDAAVRELHRATPNFHYAWLDDRNLPHDSKETPRFFDFTGKDKLK